MRRCGTLAIPRYPASIPRYIKLSNMSPAFSVASVTLAVTFPLRPITAVGRWRGHREGWKNAAVEFLQLF
jgi:hypothetical protein